MGLIFGCYIDDQDSDYVLINEDAYRRKAKMNTNETIEYEIPTEEELDVSVQAAERRGYRAGVEALCDSVCARTGWRPTAIEVEREATKLLAEQEEK